MRDTREEEEEEEEGAGSERARVDSIHIWLLRRAIVSIIWIEACSYSVKVEAVAQKYRQ